MFRWKRGLLHALIPFGLAIAAGLVLLLVTDPVDPDKLGEGVGRFGAACFVAGLGISYLAQTGKQRAAVVASIALVAGIGVLVALIVVTKPPARAHATARDRAPLREVSIGGAPHLEHPTFGFTLLRPPAGYHDSPALAATMGLQDPDTISYAYAEEPPQGGLVVSVLLGDRDLPASVRGVRKGLESAMTAQLGPEAKLRYVRDEIGVDEAHVYAVVNDALHLHINAYQLRDRDAIVMVVVVGATATQLADVLDSFQR